MLDSTRNAIFERIYDISDPMLDQKRIAKLRTRLGWTQLEFSTALGIAHRRTISQWEIGASIPGGPVMRFLTYLDTLSDPELERVAKLLMQIADKESKKSPQSSV